MPVSGAPLLTMTDDGTSYVFPPTPGGDPGGAPFGLNESELYVSAIEDESRYFSILESTAAALEEGLRELDEEISPIHHREDIDAIDIKHEALEGGIGGAEPPVEEEEDQQQQVLVFNVEGSDDLYGIQFACDDEGQVQKYQFKFRQTEQGTLEAIPETIELLPNDDPVEEEEPQEQPQLFLSEHEHDDEDMEFREPLEIDEDFMRLPNVKLEEEEEEKEEERTLTIKPEFPAGDLEEESLIPPEPSEEPCSDPTDNNTVTLSTPEDYSNVRELIRLESSNPVEFTEIVLEGDVQKGPDGDFLREIQEEQDSDDNEYEITECVPVTAEKELICDDPQPERDLDIEKIPASTGAIPKDPKTMNNYKILYGILPVVEKENHHNSAQLLKLNDTNATILNHHPRSILKTQRHELKLVPQTVVQAQRGTELQLLRIQRENNEESKRLDRLERRYSKSKEVMEAKQFHNFINRTTIPHVPQRQDRLPRKQKIKPVDNRKEEEIIVQEVMVSSDGFVENNAICGRFKVRTKIDIVSCIDIEDSDEENKPKDGVIEILSSEDDEAAAVGAKGAPPKKTRGRPKRLNKKRTKEQDSSENNASVYSEKGIRKVEEGSPSKRSRTEATVVQGKTEATCPHCPKTFPSENSLKTHLQHHALEERIRGGVGEVARRLRTRTAPAEVTSGIAKLNINHKTGIPVATRSTNKVLSNKYYCERCESNFKNTALLSRHRCPALLCAVCKTHFEDQKEFEAHKKRHAKVNLVRATNSVRVSPRKRNGVEIGAKSQIPQKYSCKNCPLRFPSVLLLQEHVRKSCVKPKTKP